MNLDSFSFDNCSGIIGIVDPEPDGYWRLAEQAEARGLFCRYAATGEEALRLAERARPALWLVNLRLPDLAGFELCRLLLARRGRTPIFLVADEYDPQAEIAALSGGLHFLCKPLPATMLDLLAGAAPAMEAAGRGAGPVRAAAF